MNYHDVSWCIMMYHDVSWCVHWNPTNQIHWVKSTWMTSWHPDILRPWPVKSVNAWRQETSKGAWSQIAGFSWMLVKIPWKIRWFGMIWDDFGMIWGAPILGFLMVSLGMTSEWLRMKSWFLIRPDSRHHSTSLPAVRRNLSARCTVQFSRPKPIILSPCGPCGPCGPCKLKETPRETWNVSTSWASASVVAGENHDAQAASSVASGNDMTICNVEWQEKTGKGMQKDAKGISS